MNNLKKIYPTKLEYTNSPQEAIKDSELCFIFTEWEEIKNIEPLEYKDLMKNPVVYDGRNIYNLTEMKECGIEYYSVGR